MTINLLGIYWFIPGFRTLTCFKVIGIRNIERRLCSVYPCLVWFNIVWLHAPYIEKISYNNALCDSGVHSSEIMRLFLLFLLLQVCTWTWVWAFATIVISTFLIQHIFGVPAAVWGLTLLRRYAWGKLSLTRAHTTRVWSRQNQSSSLSPLFPVRWPVS